MKYCNKERLVSSISKNCTTVQCASQLKHVHLIGVAFNLLASQSVAGYRGGDIGEREGEGERGGERGREGGREREGDRG